MLKKIKDLSDKERKAYHRVKMGEWRKKHRAKDLSHKKKWRDTHKEHKNRYDSEYQKTHQKTFQEYRKTYRKTNREKLNAWARENYRKNPKKYKQKKEYINAYLKRYMKDDKNHEKFIQRQKDYHKFRVLLVSIHKKCQICNSNKNLETHHLTYQNPTIKDLMLLCRKCHKELHRKIQTKGGIKCQVEGQGQQHQHQPT